MFHVMRFKIRGDLTLICACFMFLSGIGMKWVMQYNPFNVLAN